MSHIDRFMPTWALREVDHVAVAADAAAAWRAVRDADLYRVPLVRRLFQLRLIPERVLARVRGESPPPLPEHSRIDDITAGTGFHLLADAPDEAVVGAIGRFWMPAIAFAPVDREGFAGFAEPGWGKLAWSLAVAPREGGGAWVTVDLRVTATDAESRARFFRYWRLIGRFSHAIRAGILGMLAEQLGAAPPDGRRDLPGDELLKHARYQATHAVHIEAPPSRVWPWLVQMGGRRAGWYSWDILDNAGIPSADHIVPELQKLAVGDVIPALPNATEGFAVLRLEAEKLLVLGSPSLLPGAPPAGEPFDSTWAFVLEPIGAEATHLTVRVRADYAPSLRMAVLRPALGLAHEVMERKQLRTLKERVESAR